MRSSIAIAALGAVLLKGVVVENVIPVVVRHRRPSNFHAPPLALLRVRHRPRRANLRTNGAITKLRMAAAAIGFRKVWPKCKSASAQVSGTNAPSEKPLAEEMERMLVVRMCNV